MRSSFLCLNCTRDFVRETLDLGLGFFGIEYDETAPDEGIECARCSVVLPESRERELASRAVLLKAMLDSDRKSLDMTRQLFESSNRNVDRLTRRIETVVAVLDDSRRDRMTAAKKILEGGL